MIDIYTDDMHLEQIRTDHNLQVLDFKNDTKDERLCIPVDNQELLNIWQRVKIRVETLGLLPPSNGGRTAT